MAVSDNQALRNCWADMHKRCRPEHPCAHRYIERGISVCEAWASWPAFRAWALANGWRRGLEVDRRNNDAGYYPENCRFVTDAEQTKNRDLPHAYAAIQAAQTRRWSKPFRCVETGEVFETQMQARRAHAVDRKSLRLALAGTYQQAGGKRWQYLEASQ